VTENTDLHRDYPTSGGWCCHSSACVMQGRWVWRRSVQQAPPPSFPVVWGSVCWDETSHRALRTGPARAAAALLAHAPLVLVGLVSRVLVWTLNRGLKPERVCTSLISLTRPGIML